MHFETDLLFGVSILFHCKPKTSLSKRVSHVNFRIPDRKFPATPPKKNNSSGSSSRFSYIEFVIFSRSSYCHRTHFELFLRCKFWSSALVFFGAEAMRRRCERHAAAAAAAICQCRDVTSSYCSTRIVVHGRQAIAPSTLQCNAKNHPRPDSRRRAAVSSTAACYEQERDER